MQLAMCLVISGTWVRFPGPPIIPMLFFPTCSCADSQALDTISLTHPTCHVSSVQIQRTKSEEYHAQESTALHSIQEVKRAEGSNGPGFNNAPSNSSPHPPWVYLLFSYFILFCHFLFFYLFALFYFFNN